VAETWAISTVDLHLDLTGSRVRSALETALRDAVVSGRLVPGVRLPSSRALAGDLGIARNTVADAYGQLVAEGWLVARVGSGTQVATRPATEPPPAPPSATASGPRYDLRAGAPNLAAFPRAAWLTAARRALADAPATAFGYGDPRGQQVLRDAMAGYLARARGVRVRPERIVVCSGFTQALGLLGQVLAARGATTLGLEDHGHLSHHHIATAAGLATVPVPVDADGADVDTAADALLLTPAHQFPLGMPLAAHRRTAAVEWARDTGGLVIEDDYDGEFRYDRHPVGALQALAPDHVVYAGTASKSLAPGVRLAWLVLPPALVDDVAAAKRLADGHCGALDQLTLAEFVTSGGYDRQVRRARLAYRRRRDRLVAALGDGVRVSGMAAGLHALVELPPGVTEAEVEAVADQRGLAVEGLAGYRRGGRARPPALVVGYATPPDHAYTGALARLRAVISAVGSTAGLGGDDG
jgi:GntR family transcriptional regulator/MocR family aminotransferase